MSTPWAPGAANHAASSNNQQDQQPSHQYAPEFVPQQPMPHHYAPTPYPAFAQYPHPYPYPQFPQAMYPVDMPFQYPGFPAPPPMPEASPAAAQYESYMREMTGSLYHPPQHHQHEQQPSSDIDPMSTMASVPSSSTMASVPSTMDSTPSSTMASIPQSSPMTSVPSSMTSVPSSQPPPTLQHPVVDEATVAALNSISISPETTTAVLSSTPPPPSGPKKPFSYADALKAAASSKVPPPPAVSKAPETSELPAPSFRDTQKDKTPQQQHQHKPSRKPDQQSVKATIAPPKPRSKLDLPPPADVTLKSPHARAFVIKSFTEDDIHKCIKYSVWASTNTGNRRLNGAFLETAEKGPILLFFSVNGSGQFCGVARMTTAVDFESKFGAWAMDKWSGQFEVEWQLIKDVPNRALRHITLPNNEDKPVTNSRDTQEIPLALARTVLKVFKEFPHKTSILDDFAVYDDEEERKQLGEKVEGTKEPPRKAKAKEMDEAASEGSESSGWSDSKTKKKSKKPQQQKS